MATNIHYLVYCAISLSTLKELNAIVIEPYMVSFAKEHGTYLHLIFAQQG